LVKCFSYAIAQNKGKPEEIKKAIECIVPHAFGDHTKCNISWCGYKRDLSITNIKLFHMVKICLVKALRKHLIIYSMTNVLKLWLTKLHCVQIHKETKPLTVSLDKKIQKLDFMVVVIAMIFGLHVLLPKETSDMLMLTEHWRHSILNPGHFAQITTKE
jgi:hypothetical protein